MFGDDLSAAIMASLGDGKADCLDAAAVGITWSTADLPGIERGGTFVVGSRRYLVEEIVSDDGQILHGGPMTNPLSEGRQALVQRLSTIAVANGYRTDAGANVKTGWFNEVLPHGQVGFPLIVVQKAKDQDPVSGPRALKVAAGYYVIGAVDVGLDDYEDALDDLELDLLRCLRLEQGRPLPWAPAGIQNITLDEFLVENLALHSSPVAIASGTVSAEELPSGLVAGDEVQLDQRFVSSLVLTDGNASPVTLVEGTHHEIVSLAGGIVKIISPASLTQPFEAAYSYAAANSLAIFANSTPPERWIFFDGINTVTGDKVILDRFRVQFDPVSDFGLINDDWGGLQLTSTSRTATSAATAG
ncbi:hypothetical protein [Azotobacter beijerinckii]|uniref:Uncharacterized protein n=1 Tax=Azotobacter beijerinckii TaxID=170623 RepID=A0A1I3Z4Q7_9GAMM|nr:hypothetical protein [Azotobacter beijerinckii]SFA72990.1 hypothetical protein SAMN04244571_00155 [Azotobacter beijerinckii]SFK38621.1 hypothetical protein SAMN04244574_00424 [Azotobacter beijerinckii]